MTDIVYLKQGIFNAQGDCRAIVTASSIEELEAQLQEGEYLSDPPERPVPPGSE